LAVDQTSATTPPAASAQPDQASQPTDAATSATSAGSGSGSVGFGARGRVRRRARFLHKARELAYRDLGGLVYSLHRFGQRNDSLVLAKLATLTRIDAELRGLEASLSERQPVTVLREAGITACPRCAAIHSGEDRFCPNCGLPMSRNVDLPIAGAPATSTAAPEPAAPAVPSAAPAAAPAANPALSTAATAAFAAVPSPSPGASPAAAPASPVPGPASAPAPASGTPAPAQSDPATQAYPVTPPPGGRSPVPPVPAKSPSPAAANDDDQPTEIIRPPAAGS
jgi:hypothetical protein